MLPVLVLCLTIMIGKLENVEAASCGVPSLATCNCTGTIVDCSYSGLTEVPTNIPVTTTELILSFNSITSIDETSFAGLVNLIFITLSGNNINSIDGSYFSDQSSLVNLFISDQNLETIAENAFAGLSSLEVLYLSRDSLSDLPDNVFAELTSLKQLFLTGNDFTEVRRVLFQNLVSLEFLYLNKNEITEFEQNYFADLTSLTSLFLGDNPTECCTSEDFIDWGKQFTIFEFTCTECSQSIPYELYDFSQCSCKSAQGKCQQSHKTCNTNILDKQCSGQGKVCCEKA